MSSRKKPNTVFDWLWPNTQLDFSKARLLGRILGTALVILAVDLSIGVVGALVEFIAAVFHIGAYRGFPTDAAIRNIGLVLIAAVGAPFVAWRSWVAHRQADTAEEGLITDRINKAVQGLGAEKTVKRQRTNNAGTLLFEDGADGKPNLKRPIYDELTMPNLEVRIGSIYALERVANESAEDRPQIFEIFCAYVSNNADPPGIYAYPPLERYAIKEPEPSVDERFRSVPDGMGRHWAADLRPPRPDTRAAIAVIVRCIDRFSAETGTDALPALTFTGANLQRADLRRADLRGVKFEDCKLDGADLEKSDLSKTMFQNCSLIGASINGATLTDANFRQSRLECVNAGNVSNMTGCMFWDCDCSGIMFDDAYMSSSHFCVTARKGRFRAKKMDGTSFSLCDIRDGEISAHSMINARVHATWVPASGIQLMETIHMPDGVRLTRNAKKMRLYITPGQPNLVSSDGFSVPGLPEELRRELFDQGDVEQFDPRTEGGPIVTVK